jgi:hypothetical protein
MENLPAAISPPSRHDRATTAIEEGDAGEVKAILASGVCTS